MSAILTRAALQFLRQTATRPVSSAATAGGHGGGHQLWKRLTFFVAVPAIGLGVVNAVLAHQAEGHHRPEFVAYEYLRVRTKRFPWGDGNHSLFHNPHVNALPTGYENDH